MDFLRIENVSFPYSRKALRFVSWHCQRASLRNISISILIRVQINLFKLSVLKSKSGWPRYREHNIFCFALRSWLNIYFFTSSISYLLNAYLFRHWWMCYWNSQLPCKCCLYKHSWFIYMRVQSRFSIWWWFV